MNEITAFTPATFADSLPRDQRTFAPSNIGTDLLRHLPQAAADNLQKLQLRVEDLRVLCPSFQQRNDAVNEKIKAENRLKRLLDPSTLGGFNLPSDNESVLDAEREVKRLTAELARLTALNETRSAAWSAASGILAAVTTWFKNGGMPAGTTLEAVETAAPKLNKGEGLVDAIERLRHRCKELRADLHRVRGAPYPSTYARSKMREQIHQLAERGRPNVSALVARAGPVEFQTQRLRSMVIGAQENLAFGEVPDALALTAYIHRNALIAALDAEIDAAADDRSALTPAARAAREVEITEVLLDTERHEASLVFAAWEQGLSSVEHRSDISVPALLSVALVTRPAGNGAASSPGMAWPVAIGSR